LDLKGVKGKKFTFTRTAGDDAFTCFGYVDADWAGNLDNRKSKAGYLIKLGNNIISFATKNEDVVALSSAEAELMAATTAVREIIWIRKILGELGFSQDKPTILFEDNTSCIRMSKNPEFHQRTKHIDIKYYYCREKYLSKEIELVHCNTRDMQADILTKALPPKDFQRLLKLCDARK
jgi:hypothetical protein